MFLKANLVAVWIWISQTDSDDDNNEMWTDTLMTMITALHLSKLATIRILFAFGRIAMSPYSPILETEFSTTEAHKNATGKPKLAAETVYWWAKTSYHWIAAELSVPGRAIGPVCAWARVWLENNVWTKWHPVISYVHHRLTNEANSSAITAAKINWHRHGTKLRHCQPLCLCRIQKAQ